MLSKAEFRGAFLALSGLLAFILVVTSFSPGLPGELLLQTLRFHLVALGLVLAGCMYVFGVRWRVLMFLAVVGGALFHGAYYVNEFGQRRDEPLGALKGEMTFLSYNVLSGNRTPKAAADLIISTAPDVALVMETPGIEAQIPAIEAVLPYRLGCERPTRCDISLFSRHPIDNGRIIEVAPFRRERLVLAPMTIDGVALTVVGIHLSKPYFDETSIQELGDLRYVLSLISGPILLAGDFNSAVWTSPLAWFGRSADLVPAPSYPATWPVELGPLGVPIDNMFTRGDARILEIAAGEDSHGSNHRYLLARVGLYAPR
jgi:endonuclease/exonuclease/phosphatase (EEP) superfamily protein YafD